MTTRLNVKLIGVEWWGFDWFSTEVHKRRGSHNSSHTFLLILSLILAQTWYTSLPSLSYTSNTKIDVKPLITT